MQTNAGVCVFTRLALHPGSSFLGSPQQPHHLLTARTVAGHLLFPFYTRSAASHKAILRLGNTCGMKIRSSMLGEEQQHPKSTSKAPSLALSPCAHSWDKQCPHSLVPFKTKEVSLWKTALAKTRGTRGDEEETQQDLARSRAQ